MHNLWIVAAGVLLLNLPFGFWRAGVRKYSAAWMLAVHAPVPLVIAVRVSAGLGWRLSTFPVLAGAFVLGQFAGGTLRRRLRCPAPGDATRVRRLPDGESS